MTMMNVNAQGWRDYITDQYAPQKDAFGFDGTHIDTLGQTVKKDNSGNSVDLTDGLTAIVNETASKTGTVTGINLPDGAGTDKIGPSSASYIYTELWDHNETNAQVASYLQSARDKAGNKPQIVAAYANNYDPASWVADPNDSNKKIHPGVTADEGTRIEAESCEYAPSGASDLHGGRLREVGQSGHELRDQLAVTTVLHEVGQTLGRAGDLNDGAGLRGDEAHDDVLAPGHHAHRGVEGDNLAVGVGERHGRLRNGLRSRGSELEQQRERHVELECLRRGTHTHGSVSLKISVVSDTRDLVARAGEEGATRTDAVASV